MEVDGASASTWGVHVGGPPVHVGGRCVWPYNRRCDQGGADRSADIAHGAARSNATPRQAVDRHLSPDTTGHRHGAPKVGDWWTLRRIPGRARSHTRARKWETFRLVGTLAGHLAVFEQGGRLWQPRRMPAVTPAAADGWAVRAWWDHDGAFCLGLCGTGRRDLILPVPLPQGPARPPLLQHYLTDPTRRHQIDPATGPDP